MNHNLEKGYPSATFGKVPWYAYSAKGTRFAIKRQSPRKVKDAWLGRAYTREVDAFGSAQTRYHQCTAPTLGALADLIGTIKV